jgi:CRISPR/Cas system-associated exonuclease Cas4 (RecB family)
MTGTAAFDENNELNRSFNSGYDFLQVLRNFDDLLAEVFEPFISGANISSFDLLTLLQRFIAFVKAAPETDHSKTGKITSNPPDIETEFLFGIAGIIHDLHTLIKELPQFPDFETLHVLFTSIAGTMRMPFYGEPLKGIQIMGVLETRTLDFDTLIMVSVNEGLLPKGKRQDSFIPADIRREFGMPGFREHNAVFAYHFYRLLQRAKSAWLLYNTEADEMGNGEKSRFITQLLYELPVYNPEVKIEEKVVGAASVTNTPPIITIPKNESERQKLTAIAERGFSPSLLSSYLNCSLQFYFSAILGLQEPDSVEETIDASMLGTAVHNVFQKAYQPYLGKTINAEIVRSLIEPAVGMVREELRQQFSGNDLDTGKNLIIVNVARNMVCSFLETEADQLTKGMILLKILHLEEKFFGEVNIPSGENGETTKVNIKGTTDRIDVFGNQLRIIDYKTGSLQPAELNLDNPGDLSDMKKPQKMLQLLCYAWLYRQKHPEESGFVSGIISLKTPKRYLQKAKINKSETFNDDVLNRFQGYLTGLLTEIFNPGIPFQQTENQDNCKYCPFVSICNR